MPRTWARTTQTAVPTVSGSATSPQRPFLDLNAACRRSWGNAYCIAMKILSPDFVQSNKRAVRRADPTQRSCSFDETSSCSISSWVSCRTQVALHVHMQLAQAWSSRLYGNSLCTKESLPDLFSHYHCATNCRGGDRRQPTSDSRTLCRLHNQL